MENILSYLQHNGLIITTAESCTGGMIASAITDISGASGVYNQGFITYSNQAKHQLLDVPTSILESFGAVSEPAAKAMAEGALNKAKADIALASTGIAGPTGGTARKPVGTIFIAVAQKNKDTVIKQLQLHGSRQEIRQETVKSIIKLTESLLSI
jgi:PncC family amidohydrolase